MKYRRVEIASIAAKNNSFRMNISDMNQYGRNEEDGSEDRGKSTGNHMEIEEEDKSFSEH